MKINPTHRCATFQVLRGDDGKIRVGVWDRICVPTEIPDQKDGMETHFTAETMSQMVDNFVERGDQIPVDWNHQTNYASQNGRPAPALAWYGALAVVVGGKVVKAGEAQGVKAAGTDGLDMSKDGLWGYRTEVTEQGEQLLANFKYVSPTFTPAGTKRDGTECGYCLAAVAATNTPFQEGTQITFSQQPSGANPELAHKESNMKMSPEMLAKLGLADDATPEEHFAALAKFFEDSDADKAKLSKMEGDAEMAKLADDEEKAKMADDAEKAKMDSAKDDDKAEAKMAVMEASLAATRAELKVLQTERAVREKAAKAESERKYEALADAAIAGSYPKEKRAALVAFARADFDAAREMVSHLLPKTSAPAHIFERLTRNGAPASDGAASSARSEAGPSKSRKVVTMGRQWIEDDADFADEVKKLANSKEPVLMEKIDKLLSPAQRPELFHRLLAADRVVRAERPDLAATADGE